MYVPIAQQGEAPSGISISVRSAGGSPALLTKSVGPHEQGEVLGTSQSLASISQIVGPVAAGWFIGRGQLYAYGFLAGGCALVGAALSWLQRERPVAGVGSAAEPSQEPDRA